jgi:hypothetical protein
MGFYLVQLSSPPLLSQCAALIAMNIKEIRTFNVKGCLANAFIKQGTGVNKLYRFVTMLE